MPPDSFAHHRRSLIVQLALDNVLDPSMSRLDHQNFYIDNLRCGLSYKPSPRSLRCLLSEEDRVCQH